MGLRPPGRQWSERQRTLAEIRAEIEALERETEGLLGQVLVETVSVR